MALIELHHAQGRDPAQSWGSSVRTDPRVRRAHLQVAWELLDSPAFARVGCRQTDAELASALRISPFGVRNALSALRDLGHLTWVWETADGGRVRTIRPAACPDVAAQHPCKRRGGLPPGISGRQRAAEKAAAATANPQDITDTQFPAMDCLEAPGTRVGTSTGSDLAPLGESDAQPECEIPPVARDRRPPARVRRDVPDLPLWKQSRAIQVARAKRHADRLPWNACCQHDACGSQAIVFICAEEGVPVCREHGGYAVLPVALARFGLGAEAGVHRSGDFRNLSAA